MGVRSARELLGYADIAALLGVDESTVRKYRSLGRLPAPDAQFGRSPAWYRQTIEDWQRSRPGSGWATGVPVVGQGESRRPAKRRKTAVSK